MWKINEREKEKEEQKIKTYICIYIESGDWRRYFRSNSAHKFYTFSTWGLDFP